MKAKTLFSAAASLTGCALSLALIATPALARQNLRIFGEVAGFAGERGRVFCR